MSGEVGKRIKELRAEEGISQEAFAQRIGMARSYLTEVETGRRNISYDNIRRIAFGFGISVQEFFDAPVFSQRPSAGYSFVKLKDEG